MLCCYQTLVCSLQAITYPLQNAPIIPIPAKCQWINNGQREEEKHNCGFTEFIKQNNLKICFFNTTNLNGNLKALCPYHPLSYTFSLKVYMHTRAFIALFTWWWRIYCGILIQRNCPVSVIKSIWKGLLKVIMICREGIWQRYGKYGLTSIHVKQPIFYNYPIDYHWTV